MTEVPQKIRTGVVELLTDIGPLYATPSLWERIYLLWTFRNFHSLPRQVLNRREQKLIDALCGVAIVNRNGATAGTLIIGVVENVRSRGDYITESAETASKLIEMKPTSAEIVMPQAVGSEGILTRPGNPYRRTDIARPGPDTNLHYISAPAQELPLETENAEAGSAAVEFLANGARRNRLGWAAPVAACGVALLAGLFYRPQARLALPRTTPQVAIEPQKSHVRSVRKFTAPKTETIQSSAPAEPSQPASTVSLQPESPSSTANQASGNNGNTTVTTAPPAIVTTNSTATERLQVAKRTPEGFTGQPPVATTGSTPSERLQIAERPVGHYTYPVAPNPNLTGKVFLRALIGADGNVKAVDVLSGDRPLADAAAVAVRQWRYRPYEMNGRAVEVQTNVAINFVGEDVVSISFPSSH
jgi:outer membrane biosynthesis protein TonB